MVDVGSEGSFLLDPCGERVVRCGALRGDRFFRGSVVVVDHAHAEGEHQCSGDYDDEEAEAEHRPVESVEDE